MKVALVGTAPGSRSVLPTEDPSWKIWACSQGNQGVLPRVDIWFELHPMSAMTGPEHKAWGVQYLGWLRAQSFPVYMLAKNDFVPQAIEYPLGDVLKRFPMCRNWLTSSIALMGWFALMQMRRGDELGFFGVDMAAAEEHYTAQRAGLTRLIEHAEQEMGIHVRIPHESCLGQPTPIYGYSEASRMGRRIIFRSHEMEQAIGAMTAQRDKLNLEIAYAQGAKHNNDYTIRTFLNGLDAEDLVLDKIKDAATAPPQKPPTLTGDVTETRPSGLIVPKGNGAHLPEEQQR